jgi:ABC-type amino acid transport substrate-binding protein
VIQKSSGKKQFMKGIRLKALLTLACLVIGLGCSIGYANARSMEAVTRNIEPFSFTQNGKRTGYSVDLWNKIAEELKLQDNYKVAGSATQMIQDVSSGKADVAVGALSITAEREKVVDFTQPFFESGLQVMVRKSAQGGGSVLAAIASNIFNLKVGTGFIIALLVMFGISHLVWKYEHPVNEEMWPRSYWEGMGESFWWTISIFLVGGADNKGPIGKGGRIVATLWMFASVIAVSLLTASLSAVLTVNALPVEINGPDDLYGRVVGTLRGSVAETWLEKEVNPLGQKITVKPYLDVQTAIDALRSGTVKAVVYDAPILEYYISKNNATDIELVGGLFEKSNYGFALKQGSPIREPINQVMLQLKENGVIDQIHAKWFGS